MKGPLEAIVAAISLVEGLPEAAVWPKVIVAAHETAATGGGSLGHIHGWLTNYHLKYNSKGEFILTMEKCEDDHLRAAAALLGIPIFLREIIMFQVVWEGRVEVYEDLKEAFNAARSGILQGEKIMPVYVLREEKWVPFAYVRPGWDAQCPWLPGPRVEYCGQDGLTDWSRSLLSVGEK